MKAFVFAISILILSVACSQHDDASPDTGKLKGTWLLYEHGYSPGGGYIVTPVPPNPPQFITFLNDVSMTSNMNGLAGFHFYQLNADSTVLTLYKSVPIVQENSARYSLKIVDGHLILSFQYCIEGCHLAFKRADKNLFF